MDPTIASGPRPRRRERPRTCLADAREIEPTGRSAFAHAMPADLTNRRYLRKWWEWDYLAQCAEDLGLLETGRRAVGLGVGHEPLIFYFAQRGCSVLATDLYAGDTSWSEARFAQTQAVHASSPIDYPRDRVEVADADMRKLPCRDGEADFVWSCSSIEHVPTLIDLFAVFEEAHRVLKPGGYALLTTEFCLSPGPYLLPSVNAWDASILDAMKESLSGFEFVGPTDLDFDALHPANAPRLRRHLPAGLRQPFAPDFAESFRGGQVGVLLGVSHCVPIGFVLRKTDGRNRTWGQAPLPEGLRSYSDGLSHFFAGREAEALPPLQRVYESARTDPAQLQLALHAGRFVLDAHVRQGMQERPDELRGHLTEYLDLCPPGVLQDADCLDLVAYLLGELGDLDESAHVSRLALRSPSTDVNHVMALSGRFLNVQQRAGRLDAGLEEVAGYLADLTWGGLDAASFRHGFERELSPQLDPAAAESLRAAVRRRVEAMARAIIDRAL
jgi:SAM-dependent methyltransferase